MRFILILTVVSVAFSCNPDRKTAGREKAVEQPSSAGEKVAESRPAKNSTSGKDDTQKMPVIEFEETDYNFGTITEGEFVDHNFKFTNTGDAPLIISRASASCGCTVPSPPKGPILPGQSSEIHVRFNSHNKENQQVKTITIEANTTPAITKLQIHGFIVPKDPMGSTY